MTHSTTSSALLAIALLCPQIGKAEDGIHSLDDLDAEFAGPGDSEAPRARRVPRLEEFRGHLAEEFRFYPVDRKDQSGNQQLFTEAELHLDVKLVEDLGATLVPRFLIDALDTELLRYEPFEAYLSYQKPSFSLVAGQFIENFGIVDTFNPLDVLNRRDFATDLLDPVVLGELGARVKWTLPSGPVVREPTFGVYVLPLWRKTDFPTQEQRFAFRTPEGTLDESSTRGPAGIDGALMGIRFEHVLETPAISADLQYLAMRGPSRSPFVTGVATADGGSALVPQYYGEWVFGGGLRAVPEAPFWSKFTLKAELAYKRPYRFAHYRNVDDDFQPVDIEDYFQMVAGFDRAFPSLIFRKDELTLTIEYALEVGANDEASLFRPFDNDLAVRLLYSGGDFARSSLEMRGIFDLDKGEIIAEAIASRQLRFIHKDLKFQLEGRLLRPAPTQRTLLSAYPTNNSHLGARLQFDF